ncbi:uncharacterized protein LOC126871985 [Bombus huntii]|uniref:uncharacterized protein LOC126871985 n=1 Tax=Bombus huntii TaxID=85661 RepID=UPI0021AA3FF1|nr:uncharacterized protein LOC126871985 [Bombus huntii]
MASEDQLISLRRRRGYCSGRFTYVSNRLDEYEQSGRQQNSLLTNYEKQLTEAASQFETIQLELEVLDEEEQARGFEIRDQYVAVDIKLQNLLRNAQAALPSTSINLPTCALSASLNPIAGKLPDLRLPTFDGSLEKWNTFYDTFSSTIDKNPNLTEVQKFHYLQSALQGEAADCLNALPLSNINYSQAITILKESFECPRYTAVSHSMAIIDYPKLTKESPTELRRLVHTFKQHIYALNKLGDSYPDTSAVLNSLILSKIPSSIQKQWEMTLPNKELPPYIQLLNFLERLARSSRPITTVKQTRESPEQTTPVRQRAPRGHAFTATQVTPTCPTCQGPHPIWRCDTFKTKSLRERIREVKGASLCLNCLGKGHIKKHCFAGSCRVCGERHHTLLHRAKHHSGSRSSTPSPKSSPSNSRSTTPSLPPYSSPTRRKRHTTDHRSETPRTAASPSPPPSDRRKHNQ